MPVSAQLKPYREVTPQGKLILNLHPGQSRAWRSTARYPVVLAGTQSGKTIFEPDWLYREIQRKGAGDYIVGTATFPLLDLKLLPEFEELFCRLLKWGKYTDSNKSIVSKDGKSRIIFFSAVNPESMESATAKGAVLDEAGQKYYKRATWEAVQRRLSINQGRCLFGTTLYSLGWLKTEVYDRAIKGDKDFDIIQFDSIMNPAFPQAEYDKQRSLLPAWKFDMFYRGRYTKPAGLIYDCFDEAISVIPRFDIPESWTRYVGHDFGPVHTAALWAAQEPGTGYLYLYREYLTTSKTSAEDNVQEWLRLTGKEPVRKRVGGSGGNQSADEGWRQAYALAGWSIAQPTIEAVEVGIDRVYAWKKQKRLFVFNDLFGYLDENSTYSRELNDKYEPTEKIENKEEYHILDAERYLLCDFQAVEPKSPGTGVTKVKVWR